MVLSTFWVVGSAPNGRAPPFGFLFCRVLRHGGASRPLLQPMSWMAFARITPALLLPAALTAAWWQRRASPESGDDHPRPGPDSEGADVSVDVQPRMRPSRRELARMVREGSSLEGTDLRHARLRGSDLRDRSLADADLSRGDLRGATLTRADLSNAVLDFADLADCDLRDALLVGASLVETSLWKADLRGADLSGVRNIVMANLKRARYDSSTTWPRGVDPDELGAEEIRERSDRP